MSEPKVTCRDATAFLMRYLDRELSEAERATFEKHLVDCPPCEDFLESYKTTIRLGHACSEDAPPIPDALQKAIVAAMKKGRTGS